jgi:DNA-binding transcriptional ArsR family regulator
MVEYLLNLDLVFGSLSDPTRRDILSRLIYGEMAIGEIAKNYKVSFAAISKHLMVMEKAGLIKKQRQGNEQIVQIVPNSIVVIDEYLDQYRNLLEGKMDRLEIFLEAEQHKSNEEGVVNG